MSGQVSAVAQPGAYAPKGFVSGVKAPEDLMWLPGTPWVVVSSMQTANEDPGHLYLIDAVNPAHRQIIYPSAETPVHRDAARFPGCANSPEAAKFFPHGINYLQRDGRDFELYAINHGGRESVEVFRIKVQTESVESEWIGCVPLPPHSYGNGVAPLHGRGLVISKMYDPSDRSFLKKFDAGIPTGTVLRWTPERGWFPAIHKRLSGANGVETSPDGRWLYVSEWSARKLWKIPLHGNGLSQSIVLDFLPDNLRWTTSGNLLLTGQNATPSQVFGCDARHAVCPADFTVLQVAPTTLQTRVLVRGGNGEFGGATGAARVNNELWVGSFHGDRVARYSFATEPELK